MNIEIIEFYPLEHNEVKGLLTGTLRVRLPNIGIHLLGVYVSKKKDYWHFTLPGRRGESHETGEVVWYPFLAFEDKEMQRQLIDAIRLQGLAFIEKRLADTENPLNFPEKNQQQQQTKQVAEAAKQVKPAQEKVNTTPSSAKKLIPQAQTSSIKGITPNTWVSLPPRKPPLKKYPTTRR